MKRRVFGFLSVVMILAFVLVPNVQAALELTEGESAFLSLLDYAEAEKDLAMLVEEIGTRVAGTEAEKPAIAYIEERLNEIGGIEVTLQDFVVNTTPSADLILDGKAYSAGAPDNNPFYLGWGSAEGEPVLITDPAGLDPQTDLSGKIAFFLGNARVATNRETREKTVVHEATYQTVAKLLAMQPEAIVIVFDFNTEETERYQLRVSRPSLSELTLPEDIAAAGIDIPLVAVNRFAYDDILEIVGDNAEAIVPIGSAAVVSNRPFTKTQNIIGLKKASVPTDRTIYVTSHYDSVLASPGANDNGSGVVMMIAIARAFEEIETDYNIAFIAFGAEEIGLKGARHYVSELTKSGEIANAVSNYNMDMIATSQEDCEYIFMNSSVDKEAPVDSVKLETYVTAISRLAAKKAGFDLDYYHVIYDTTTDHYAFHEAGVPAVEYDWRANVEGNAFEAYYHTYYDDMEHNFSIDRLKLQETSSHLRFIWMRQADNSQKSPYHLLF